MNVSLLKRIIKEELVNSLKEASSYKGIEGSFDTALQWIWFFGGKELLQNKLGIYSTSQNYFRFKKAMENGEITIQDLDKATKGEHGQAGGIPFSQTAVWTQDIKPYLDRVKQDKINDLNIDLEEETATGAIGVGAGPIMTTKAFAPKGQKTNRATQTAMKQGFKKASGMPKNSKMLDYKELWKGKKSAMNEEEKKVKRIIVPNKQKGIADKVEIASILNKIITDVYKESNLNSAKQLFYDLMNDSNINDSVKKRMLSKVQEINTKPALDRYLTNSLLDYEGLKVRESNYDMASQYGAPSGYTASSGYTAASGYTGPSLATKEGKLQEVVQHIIKEELLNEVSYNKFKNEVKYRTKAEMLHKGIREVKRKLAEVDQLIEYTTRIKQELSENDEGSGYWKRSLKAINEISEISNKISNKIKSIYQ